jgi:hypothetical protein
MGWVQNTIQCLFIQMEWGIGLQKNQDREVEVVRDQIQIKVEEEEVAQEVQLSEVVAEVKVKKIQGLVIKFLKNKIMD